MSDGYVNFLRRRTLPNDDTGIVAVTLRRNLYFPANAHAPQVRTMKIQFGYGHATPTRLRAVALQRAGTDTLFSI
jgi:hypothetical protein